LPYSSPNVLRVINLRKIRWTGHVARMITMNHYVQFITEGPRERDHLGHIGIVGRVLLNIYKTAHE
jgi:hypothetical protein